MKPLFSGQSEGCGPLVTEEQAAATPEADATRSAGSAQAERVPPQRFGVLRGFGVVLRVISVLQLLPLIIWVADMGSMENLGLVAAVICAAVLALIFLQLAAAVLIWMAEVGEAVINLEDHQGHVRRIVDEQYRGQEQVAK